MPVAGGVTVGRTVQYELAKQSPSERVPAAGGITVGIIVLGPRSTVRAACRTIVNVPIQITGKRADGRASAAVATLRAVLTASGIAPRHTAARAHTATG